MRTKLFLILILIFSLFSCTKNIKPTQPSKAPKIRVLLGKIDHRDSLLFDGKYSLQLEEAQYELGKKNAFFYLSPSKTGFKIYNQNRLFVFNANDIIRLTPLEFTNNKFKFRNKWYKGEIILQLDDNASILLINNIDLEEYLKSVLVGEMPSDKDGYLEALKAQAICARTYAINKMNQRQDNAYHVYGDFHDQEYAGLEKRTKLADYAVETTRGVVLKYQDTLAQIYYHSTCGGILEDINNLWSGQSNLSYLSSRKDVLGDTFTCAISPYFRWERTFTIEQIDSLFGNRFHRSLLKKPLTDTLRLRLKIDVNQRTSSGRVKSLTLTYADTSVVLKDFEIRRFFSKFNSGNLPSLLFKISSSSDSVLVINGGGFGHGIGLCQWGAMNMSLKGFKYYDILVNQYFPGTYLKRMY
ncbi:MAG: SpoIID/LytB domain-containing protein [Calditrichaeota bacterium]|nr:SpoIID/LytB domain-containing protein [Calditrichota bacterium]